MSLKANKGVAFNGSKATGLAAGTTAGDGIEYAQFQTRTQRGVAHMLPLNMAGNSYGANTSNAGEIYFDRLKDGRLNSRVWNNCAVASSRTADMCAALYGSVALTRQGTAQNAKQAIVATSTYTPTAQPGGVWILDTATNDAGFDGITTGGGTTAKSRAGFNNTLDALMRLIRASSVVDDTNAAFTYTGTWGTFSGQAGARGGTIHYTTTPGDKVSYAWTGNDADLIIIALDSAGGTTGAAFTLKLDGVTYVNPNGVTTTNDQFRNYNNLSALAYTQMAIPVRGAGAGSHTLEVTHAGSSGNALYVDCALVPSPTPPTIIVNKTPLFGTTGFAAFTAASGSTVNLALFQTYDAIIDTVAARFPSDGSVVVWDPKAAGMDPATMLSGADTVYVHLNDYGNQWYSDKLGDIIEALPQRPGLDGSPTSPLPTPRIPTGGTTGQYLTKATGNDYDTAWTDRPARRVVTTASTATLTIDASSYDAAKVTAQAAPLTVAAPTGTPTPMQGLIIRIKDNGTARALTWNAVFRIVGTTLPTTTAVSKTLYVGCVYNSDDSKWDVIAVAQEA